MGAGENPNPSPMPRCAHLSDGILRSLPTVKEKLRLDPDSEIATTGVRVSLICPVSWGQPPPWGLSCGCASSLVALGPGRLGWTVSLQGQGWSWSPPCS